MLTGRSAFIELLKICVGSDHNPIVLSSPEAVPSSRVSCWRVDRTDWDLVCILSKINCKTEESERVEDAVAYLTSFLQLSSEQSIPKMCRIFNRRPVPW